MDYIRRLECDTQDMAQDGVGTAAQSHRQTKAAQAGSTPYRSFLPLLARVSIVRLIFFLRA